MWDLMNHNCNAFSLNMVLMRSNDHLRLCLTRKGPLLPVNYKTQSSSNEKTIYVYFDMYQRHVLSASLGVCHMYMPCVALVAVHLKSHWL